MIDHQNNRTGHFDQSSIVIEIPKLSVFLQDFMINTTDIA